MEKNEFLKLIGHVLNEKPSEFIKQFSDMMKMKLAESMETEEDGVLTEASKPAWFIVNSIGNNMTAHTSQPLFKSKEDAEAYKKKYSYVPGFKSAKILYGVSDQYGFITEIV